MSFNTEFEFTLPKGYIDEEGNLHTTGVMRLATAADEILPMRDPRVQQNPGYLSVILLARVVTKLGSLKNVDTKVIEKMFTVDLAFLQNLYRQINEAENVMIKTVCPKCEYEFEVAMNLMGESRM